MGKKLKNGRRLGTNWVPGKARKPINVFFVLKYIFLKYILFVGNIMAEYKLGLFS